MKKLWSQILCSAREPQREREKDAVNPDQISCCAPPPCDRITAPLFAATCAVPHRVKPLTLVNPSRWGGGGGTESEVSTTVSRRPTCDGEGSDGPAPRRVGTPGIGRLPCRSPRRVGSGPRWMVGPRHRGSGKVSYRMSHFVSGRRIWSLPFSAFLKLMSTDE